MTSYTAGQKKKFKFLLIVNRLSLYRRQKSIVHIYCYVYANGLNSKLCSSICCHTALWPTVYNIMSFIETLLLTSTVSDILVHIITKVQIGPF